VPDNHASSHRLYAQEQVAGSKLATSRLALDNCRGHLVPLLSLPDLSAHPALRDILARYTLRMAAL
jgi:hypothetical protein